MFFFVFRRNKNIVTSDTIGQFSRSTSGLSGDGAGDDAVSMVPMSGIPAGSGEHFGEAMGYVTMVPMWCRSE